MNGIGKSTLLKTLLGIIKPFEGNVKLGDYLEVGYFEQESSRENSNTPMDEVWSEFQGLQTLKLDRLLQNVDLQMNI